MLDLRSNVVAQYLISFTQVEFSVQDHWMGPTGAVSAAGDAEAALLFEFVRIGFNQSHCPVTVADVEMAIGGSNAGRLFASPARLPLDLARHQIGTKWSPFVVGVAVDVIADKYNAAMFVGEFWLGFGQAPCQNANRYWSFESNCSRRRQAERGSLRPWFQGCRSGRRMLGVLTGKPPPKREE